MRLAMRPKENLLNSPSRTHRNAHNPNMTRQWTVHGPSTKCPPSIDGLPMHRPRNARERSKADH
eukprot:10604645-Alexandrium_andersonii.AAC.1